MAQWYAKRDATGRGDGSTPEDAFTDLATLAATIGDGDRVDILASAAPWVGGVTLTADDLTIDCHDAWFTNGRTSTAWAESAGVWSITGGAAGRVHPAHQDRQSNE